jgi:hypothetical protein
MRSHGSLGAVLSSVGCISDDAELRLGQPVVRVAAPHHAGGDREQGLAPSRAGGRAASSTRRRSGHSEDFGGSPSAERHGSQRRSAQPPPARRRACSTSVGKRITRGMPTVRASFWKQAAGNPAAVTPTGPIRGLRLAPLECGGRGAFVVAPRDEDEAEMGPNQGRRRRRRRGRHVMARRSWCTGRPAARRPSCGAARGWATPRRTPVISTGYDRGACPRRTGATGC